MKADNYLKRKGLGAVTPLPASVVNYQVPIPTAPTNGGGFFNTLNNVFSKVSNVITKAQPIVSNVQSTINTFKNGQPNNSVPMAYNPNTGVYEQTKPGMMSTTTKVLIGAGVVGTVGLLAYAFTGKKKK